MILARFFKCEIQIGLVLEQTTIKDISSVLEHGLPRTSQALVARTLGLVKLQHTHLRRLAKSTLIWLTQFKQPVEDTALCHALAMDHCASQNKTFDEDAVPTIESVLASCKGLATRDLSTSTIVLNHYDVQQHLQDIWKEHYAEERAKLATVCLKYLHFLDLEEIIGNEVTLGRRLKDYPFLEYATRWWPSHFHQANSRDLEGPVLYLFSRPAHLTNTITISIWKSEQERDTDYTFPAALEMAQSMPLLHIAADFGLSFIVKRILTGEISRGVIGENSTHILPVDEPSRSDQLTLADIFKRDKRGRTALDIARSNGHREIFQTLFEFACDVHTRPPPTFSEFLPSLDDLDMSTEELTYYVRSPERLSLIYAVQQNNRGALVALLHCRQTVQTFPEKELLQALSLAIKMSSLPLVQALVDYAHLANRPIPEDFSTKKRFGGDIENQSPGQTISVHHDRPELTTPLILAVRYGSPGLVKFLLRAKAEVNHTYCGVTALGLAVYRGDSQVVEDL